MFSTVSNAAALSIRWRQRYAALTPSVLAAEHENAEAARRTAQRLSSGNVPAAYLKRAARQRGAGLYSVANPAPPAPAWIINAQSTRLKRSWRVYVSWRGDGTRITLWNTAPYAKYMVGGGESKMIPRPILKEVLKLERRPRLARLEKARRAALQKR